MTASETPQPVWEDTYVGQELLSEQFPLSLYRLVVAAGANRDFNSIHHNPGYAAASGAPTAYANHIFLQGMWEKSVRRYIGSAGTIRAVRRFRMRSFNTAADTVTVNGVVTDRWIEQSIGLATIAMWSTNSHGLSVGPGEVEVTMLRRKASR
jgi:acyl dehydratase